MNRLKSEDSAIGLSAMNIRVVSPNYRNWALDGAWPRRGTNRIWQWHPLDLRGSMEFLFCQKLP